MNDMRTILATAYAINPFKGSEDGMGWNFVLQIARFNKVIAITRSNNKQHIERFMAERPNPLYKNIQVVYFDLPYWMRFWKKGGRGAMVYYWMWQRAMPSFIRKRGLKYDIVHNLNFHNDWTPSYLWKLNKPFVWGPIGHHSVIPGEFIKEYGLVATLRDRLTGFVKNVFWTFSPALKATRDNADHILCMNSSVEQKISLRESNFSIMPSVATEDQSFSGSVVDDTFTIVSAGRFVPLKGFDLTILAFAKFIKALTPQQQEKCKLILVGDGPLKHRLNHLVECNQLNDKVKVVQWMERSKLMTLYQNASAFLFPSHEGAGMVVAEALSFGVPVICLDNEGPGEFINTLCGIAAPRTSRQATIDELADGIYRIYSDEAFAKTLRAGARRQFLDKFHWDRRGERLLEIYKSLVA